MDRAETTGLGVALAAHGVLLAALSLSLADNRLPPVRTDPIEVSFVGPAALVSAAPSPSPEAPAPSPAALSEPIPAAALPEPPPPLPPPRTSETPRQKADPPPPQPRSDGRRADRRPNRDFDVDIGDSDNEGRSTGQAAAVMNAQAAAGIAGLIRRQVQPCANRMVSPGPGANRIKVTINLRLDRDGSLAAPPRVIGSSGLDDENRRYLQRVKELAISAFTSCSPLRGLPAELYAVRNGWNDFDMIYNLP